MVSVMLKECSTPIEELEGEGLRCLTCLGSIGWHFHFKVENSTFEQCFAFGSAWICIDFSRLDPKPGVQK
jgi:hypothetical protein